MCVLLVKTRVIIFGWGVSKPGCKTLALYGMREICSIENMVLAWHLLLLAFFGCLDCYCAVTAINPGTMTGSKNVSCLVFVSDGCTSSCPSAINGPNRV